MRDSARVSLSLMRRLVGYAVELRSMWRNTAVTHSDREDLDHLSADIEAADQVLSNPAGV